MTKEQTRGYQHSILERVLCGDEHCVILLQKGAGKNVVNWYDGSESTKVKRSCRTFKAKRTRNG